MPIAPFFRSAGCAMRLALAFAATAFAVVFAQTPSAADGFDPNVDGNIYAVVVQPDGRVLIGGQFTAVGGVARSNLARLNADGTVDAGFNPSANASVRAIVLQPDNRIVVGGDFTTLQPGGAGATVARGLIARLNADGSVDAGFNPNLSGDIQPQVHALAVMPSGQVVAGGTFTRAGAAQRQFIARFDASGALDTRFIPHPNGFVLALAPHVDGKLVVGGGFTTLWPEGDAVPSTRNRIARLNANGTIDSEFNPNANNGVTALAVQRDGKILLGGFFTTLQPIGNETAANRVRFARLNVNGTLDSEFYPRVEGPVASIAVQGDGSLLVGGAFNSVWGRGLIETARSNVARFLPDASLDSDFAPVLNGAVAAVAALPDGRVLVGGQFTRALPRGAVTPLIRNRLARLNGDGSLDASFELDAGGRILASVTQADGRLVVAGTFTSVGGFTHNYVARLNADGSVDNTYNPDFNGRVFTLALQPDGKVIVGGAFTEIRGEKRERLARLNTNGTIDSEFYPHFDGQVGSVVLQPDGKILVGGSFTNVQAVGATTPVQRANLARLNANGTLDTPFDPEPNSSVAVIALQSDGKIVIGGLFTTLQPGGAPTITTTNGVTTTTISTATITPRNNLARLNADGTLDTTFNPRPNAQVSAIVVQSDGKVVVGGAFTSLDPEGAPSVTVTNANGTTTTTTVSTRNRIARLGTDGKVDTAFDPNANGNVLALALQTDGKILLGGSFTTLQPNGAATWTLRKYAARLNTDGTIDTAFNLDLSELGGNRVDSLRLQANGTLLIGGAFTSLHPAGTPARLARKNFARLTAAGAVDATFDASTGGTTRAIVNALAVQPDGKVIAGGDFADLGGAKSTNIARFRAEGTPDPDFSTSLATDGAINAVVVRPNGAPVASQLRGFAWLNANGTLRAAFAPSVNLSGEVSAVAVQPDGRLLIGGTFTDLGGLTGGNLIRVSATGAIDTSFNPAPNGQVTGILVQADGRIVIVGAFTTVGGVARNRIARVDANGALDTTYDPSANALITTAVLESGGTVLVGGAFTSFTPNLATTAVTRNYLARVNADGSIAESYNPTMSGPVQAIVLDAEGKAVVGGAFNTLQPLGGTLVTRNNLARLNSDGTADQNFDPNVNGPVYALVPLANGQLYVGGAFSTLTPSVGGGVSTRNNLARINSDGRVDTAFDPNANGSVTTLALQADGALLVGGVFTTLQPAGTTAAIARNRLARVTAAGALDFNFNPDVNGSVVALAARPDGSVLVGGGFTALQLNASIYVGGRFAAIGGVSAANLAALNDNGSVNATFQPRPNGAVNALLVLPDGRAIAGGEFTSIAGAARNRLARFTADGSLDPSFTAGSAGTVRALAFQPDGKVLVGGAAGLVRLNADGSADASFTGVSGQLVTAIAVQPDGRVLYVLNQLSIGRLTAAGVPDNSFAAAAGSAVSLAVQADGRIVVSGTPSRLVRLNADGSVDATFNPAPNGAVSAVAVQADGRVVAGGSFTAIGGQPRVGIARLAATAPATQQLGVTANRATIIWNRGGTGGEVAAVVFERSLDRVTWTRVGEGVRVGGGSADWQIGGQNLPASGLFYVRARGLTPSSSGTSSGIFESVREFNFTNPLAGPAATSITTPAQAAAPTPAIDPITGIAARATVTMVAGEGTVEIFAAPAVSASLPAVLPTPRLTNISTRGRVAPGEPLILGFALVGAESRPVLLRATGPGLAGFGVQGALTATRLQVFDATGAPIAANEGWAGAAAVAQAAAATGAFPFAAGSADSALLLTLAPGAYTIHVTDPRNAGGIALAEIYDAGTNGAARLVNVSSRGAAGTGAAALISGFVLARSDTGQRVLLRGIGPGLVRFGATGVVTDPTISLYDAEGRVLGSNDNWVSSLSVIADAAAAVGAFPLDTGSRDAAVLATLPSGAYTVQVTAATAGTALLEIYEVR